MRHVAGCCERLREGRKPCAVSAEQVASQVRACNPTEFGMTLCQQASQSAGLAWLVAMLWDARREASELAYRVKVTQMLRYDQQDRDESNRRNQACRRGAQWRT